MKKYPVMVIYSLSTSSGVGATSQVVEFDTAAEAVTFTEKTQNLGVYHSVSCVPLY